MTAVMYLCPVCKRYIRRPLPDQRAAFCLGCGTTSPVDQLEKVKR